MVVEHIIHKDKGAVITRYFHKLATEEKCCQFALKTINKCVSINSDFDEYFLNLKILPKLVDIMNSSLANDRKHILYYSVYIIA